MIAAPPSRRSPKPSALLGMMVICALIMAAGCERNPVSTDAEDGWTDRSGPYVGQTSPEETPLPFLPSIITEEVHSTAVFSPDGNEVYWTPMEEGLENIRCMRVENGVWTQPRELAFGNSHHDGEPCFSPDGGRLYFTSWRAPGLDGYIQKENLWYADRAAGGWDDPVILPPVINDLILHWSFSIADNGNPYFAAHPMGEGDTNDIYCAEFEGGAFVRRTKLGDSINTAGSEDTPFVTADESYLIFARVPDFSSYADMYISFREEDGTWGEAVPMAGMNTAGHELGPHLSPDGLYLFFVRMAAGGPKSYWVSAEIIDEYR